MSNVVGIAAKRIVTCDPRVSTPANSRIVVPEFEQSRGAAEG